MKHKLVITIFFILCSVLLLSTLKGVPGNPSVSMVKGNLDQATKPLELSPERGRYLLTMSLAENGTFSLPQAYADAAYPDVGYYQGKFYIFFAPGMSLFALPFYVIGKSLGFAQVGAFSVVTLFALLNLIVIYLIGKKIFSFSDPHALLASLVFGFASSAWAYAGTLYQHQTTTFFILSGFYAVWNFRRASRFAWMWGVWVWFAYGAAIFIDYPNALLLLPVIMYFFFSSVTFQFMDKAVRVIPRWSFFATAVLFAVIMFIHGYYNLIHYGGWTKLSGGLVGYKAIIEEKLLSTPEKQSALKKLEEEKDPVGFFSEYKFPFGLYTFTLSSDRGVYVYYPVFVLALFGIWRAIARRNTEHAVLIGTLLVVLFLYSSFGDPWGGWAFGSRYMIPGMAILSLYVVYWYASFKKRIISTLAFVVLFVYSTAVALAGALTTNAVPPQIEADYLKTKHNFMLNYDYLMSGSSSSFIYNVYFSHSLVLTGYFLIILLVVLYLFISLLVWARRYSYEG